MRASIEVVDIFRAAGPAYRATHAGHLSLHQLKIMSAVERCRTAALDGHVEACTDCGHWRVAYNSCRNRHCPKCQGAAARAWLAEREADLLPVGYFHVVFTLPTEVGTIAFQNKALVYDLLFRAAADTMQIIAAEVRKEVGNCAVGVGVGGRRGSGGEVEQIEQLARGRGSIRVSRHLSCGSLVIGDNIAGRRSISQYLTGCRVRFAQISAGGEYGIDDPGADRRAAC